MNLILLAKELGARLKSCKLLLTTAESCTGGGLSYWITSVAGSSNWFERGFVTYSNAAKIDMLGIHATTLEKYGAVSEEVAREMALGALSNSKANVSIAITGIAGPDGGTIDKPVGTVWIAWAKRDGFLQTREYHYKGDRQEIRDQTIYDVMNEMMRLIS